MGPREQRAAALGRTHDVSTVAWSWLTSSIIAQLFPSTRKESYPPGAPKDSDTEGAMPNLGPNGMYASLGWEDFDTLLPWIELRGGGADHGSRRAGMGFEIAEE